MDRRTPKIAPISDRSQSAGEPPRPTAHLAFLDGVRACAAVFVLIHHAYLTIWPPEYKQAPTGLLAACLKWMLYGHFAVDVFIVLSGFCLMLPVVRHGDLRGGTWAFYLRRARRILPPYYFALAASALLDAFVIRHPTGTHDDFYIQVTAHKLIWCALLLQDLKGDPINHAFWSIAVEWRIYLVFPLLVLAWRRLGPVPATAATVLLSAAFAFGVRHDLLAATAPHYLALFAMGTIAAGVVRGTSPSLQALRHRNALGLMAVVLVGVVAAICHRIGWQWTFFQLLYIDLLAGVATALLLAYMGLTPEGALTRVFSSRPLVWIGAGAYSLYLLHAPLLQVFWQYALHPLHLSRPVTLAVLILIGGPMIVGVTRIFFHFCERPFMSQPTPKTERQVEAVAIASPAP